VRGTHREFQGTIGAALNAEVRAHVFNRDVPKYKSCVEASLFNNNIPPRVYTQLLADVHSNLPTLHRYLKLRKRMMRVDTLRYEDLYPPIVMSGVLEYTPEHANGLGVREAAPFGKAYGVTLGKGATGGCI